MIKLTRQKAGELKQIAGLVSVFIVNNEEDTIYGRSQNVYTHLEDVVYHNNEHSNFNHPTKLAKILLGRDLVLEDLLNLTHTSSLKHHTKYIFLEEFSDKQTFYYMMTDEELEMFKLFNSI